MTVQRNFRLAEKLLRGGATQMTVAQWLEVNQSTISRWIQDGKIRVPKNRTGPRSTLRASLRSQHTWILKDVMQDFGVSRWTARRALLDIGRVCRDGIWTYRPWSRRPKQS